LKSKFQSSNTFPLPSAEVDSHLSSRAMTRKASENGEAESTGRFPVRRGQARGTMILLSGHKVERDQTVATSEGSLERSSRRRQGLSMEPSNHRPFDDSFDSLGVEKELSCNSEY
jgi:hypothetical protein